MSLLSPTIQVFNDQKWSFGVFPVADIMRNASYYELVRGRRGHVKRAYRKSQVSGQQISSLLPGGNTQSFLEQLPTGKVWALKGSV